MRALAAGFAWTALLLRCEGLTPHADATPHLKGAAFSLEQIRQPAAAPAHALGHSTRGIHVEKRSAGNELVGALIGGFLGLLFFFLGFPIVYLNERRQVKMYELFGRAEEMCIIDVNPEKVDAANEARVVHISGTSAASDKLKDPDFGVGVEGCAKFQRWVEMLQWNENRRTEKRGDTEVTIYSYERVWHDGVISSQGFHDRGHDNPTDMPLSTDMQTAAVSLGAFELPEPLVDQMVAWEDCTQICAPPCKASGVTFVNTGKVTGIRRLKQSSSISLALHQGNGGESTPDAPAWYLGSWAPDAAPGIGDVRVQFRKVPCGDCTVLAVQHGASFAPLNYAMHLADGKVTHGTGKLQRQSTDAVLDHADEDDEYKDNPCGCGANSFCACLASGFGKLEVYELSEQKVSAGKMFEIIQSEQNSMHYRWNGIGWFLFVFGLFLQLNVIPVLLSTVFKVFYAWNIGDAIESFGATLMLIISVIVGSIVFLLTYAVCWMAARPLKTLFAVAIAAGLGVIPYFLKANADEHVANLFF